MPEYKDKVIKCTDCGEEFISTAGNKLSMLKKVSIMNLKDVNHVVKKENKKKKRISNYIEMKISFFRGII